MQQQTDVLQSVPSNVPILETPSPEPKQIVVKKEGWRIPALNESMPVESSKSESDNPSKLSITKYNLGYVGGKTPILEQSFFSDEERRTLKMFPSKFGDLAVRELLRYDIDGRKWCFLVYVNPKGTGANIKLYFYDLDGDDSFETVTTQSGRLAPDLLPNWAK